MRQLLVGLAIAAILAVMTAPAAMAVNYNVSANPYTASHVVTTSTNPYDTHELTAGNGQNVAYTMTVTTSGGCAQLFFVKGHNVGPSSQYYIAYSQENCVTSYSNSFPVASNDGTQFTVLIATTQSQDVNYTASITVSTPAIPSWAIGLLVVIAIVVILAIVRGLLRRRRKPAMMPPISPPPPAPGQYPPPPQPPYGPPPTQP